MSEIKSKESFSYQDYVEAMQKLTASEAMVKELEDQKTALIAASQFALGHYLDMPILVVDLYRTGRMLLKDALKFSGVTKFSDKRRNTIKATKQKFRVDCLKCEKKMTSFEQLKATVFCTKTFLKKLKNKGEK